MEIYYAPKMSILSELFIRLIQVNKQFIVVLI